MSPEDRQLLDAALAVRQRAYAPYSRYPVGAALRDERGRIHVGCNVENAAHPQGVCAEAGAISAMVAAGGTRITAVAVAGGRLRPAMPCGGCRQKLREFAADEVPVRCTSEDGVQLASTVGALLPHSFGPEDLA
ncbi:MAG: cytidine deaminase [Rubrivivax sp.]